MQIKPIVYENLTPRQRVIATIEAEARDDQDEVQRLVKSCPKKTYRANDSEYTETMHELMYVTLGVEYELQRNALGFMAALYLDNLTLNKFLQNIADIQAAWQETLEGMGIEPVTMRKATSLVPMVIDALEELLPDPDLENVNKIAADMKKCFC